VAEAERDAAVAEAERLSDSACKHPAEAATAGRAGRAAPTSGDYRLPLAGSISARYWFTSTFTGMVTVQAWTVDPVTGALVAPDPNVPPYSGHLQTWFGGSFKRELRQPRHDQLLGHRD
jgi:hypothetical protein